MLKTARQPLGGGNRRAINRSG